jgi:hypothetical protein
MERRAVQPDDVPVVVSKLRVVAVVRTCVMWLKMVMDERMRVVGISLVQVIRRRRRQEGDI